MKYMLLIDLNEGDLDEAYRERCYGQSTRLAHDLKDSGHYLAAPLCTPRPRRPASGCATANGS
jgi:hypothetical protein